MTRHELRELIWAGRTREAEALLQELMWDGNTDKLFEIAGCDCCCGEHTFESCPARLWYACRGQESTPIADREAWVKHYQQHHGMTREEFFG